MAIKRFCFIGIFFMYGTLFATESISGLSEYIEKTLEIFKVPGASVAVVVDDKVVLEQGFGTCQVGHDYPVTEKTLFSIGSCTKAFTAHLLGQLVDEKKLGWDDPVVTYLPEFAAVSSEITIRDILAHRTGYLRHDPIWIFQDVAKEDLCIILQSLSSTYPLGTQFTYNNLMYGVAGLVIEKLMGCSWEEAVTTRICVPLGMVDTVASNIQNCPLGHADMRDTVTQVPNSPMSAIAPAGGIYSTLSDMVKWATGHKTLLLPNTLQELYTISMQAPAFDPLVEGYGLGWFVGTYHGHQLVGHSGTIQGYFAELYMVPEKDISIIILTNSSSDGVYAINCIRGELLDRLLGLAPVDWIAKYAPIQAKAKQNIKHVTDTNTFIENANDYCKTFAHPAYGTVTISQEENRLYLTYGICKAQLTAKETNIFTCEIPTLQMYGINPLVNITFKEDATLLEIPFEGFRNSPPITFTEQPNEPTTSI